MLYIVCALSLFVLLEAKSNAPTNRTPFMSQTLTGYYKAVSGDSELYRVPAGWFQDDANSRLRVDVGAKDHQFMRSYFYLSDKTYDYHQRNGTKRCKLIPDFTYKQQVSSYGSPNQGYAGRIELKDNRTADVYMGQSLDAYGPTFVNLLIAPEDDHYMGIFVLGSIKGQKSFNAYMFHNATLTAPSASYFDLPDECKNPDETVNYWDKWNKDGTSAAAAESSGTCSSSDNGGNIFQNLYRMMCCNMKPT